MKPIEVTMTFKKSTKNTHVYNCEDDKTPVTTLYIQRSAVGNDTPPFIKVVISDE